MLQNQLKHVVNIQFRTEMGSFALSSVTIHLLFYHIS